MEFDDLMSSSAVGAGSPTAARTTDKIVAACVCAVLSAVPMNYEFQKIILERAKELVRNRSQRRGEGPGLPHGDWEVAARVVAGICRYYISPDECETRMDEIFSEAQRIKEGLDRCGDDADYLEGLDIASRVRGEKN